MSLTPEDLIRSLPCWRGPLTIEPLSGGLSNMNFKVADSERVYVVRLGLDFPFHHVSRKREAAASQAAAAAGIGPRVVYSGEGVLVSDFLDGRTFTAADLRANLPAVVDLVRRCHSRMRLRIRGEASTFWVFHVVRDYADILRSGGHVSAAELLELTDLAAGLETAQIALPIVFGHHDLLPGNFLGDDKRIWLIDWEYAGFGTAMFDIANLADNGEYDGALEMRLLELYFDRAPEPDMIHAFAAMKLASALREMLWARVSEIHLAAPGADYVAYAEVCRTKFETARRAYLENYGPI